MNDHAFTSGAKHPATIAFAKRALTDAYGLDTGSDLANVVVAPDYDHRKTRGGACVHIEAEATAPDGNSGTYAARIYTTDLGAVFRAIEAADADDSDILPAPVAVHAVYL